MKWILVLLLIALLSTAINCQDELDEFDDEEEEVEKETEPIARRQFKGVRDTIRNFADTSARFLANNRLVKGVQSAILSVRRPASAATPVSQTPGLVSTIYRTMRSHWAKQTLDANQAFRRQLQTISKRLTNSKIIIGNLGAKLSNRDESSTKDATKLDEAPPTAAAAKLAEAAIEAQSKTVQTKESSSTTAETRIPEPSMMPVVPVPVMPFYPPVYDAPFYPEW